MGVGLMFSVCWWKDPLWCTENDNLDDEHVKRWANLLLEETMGMVTMRCVPETSSKKTKELHPRTVQNHHFSTLDKILENLVYNDDGDALVLNNANLTHGICTGKSKTDGFMKVWSKDLKEALVRAFLEAKGVKSSTEDGLPQCFAYGTAAVVQLLEKGVNPADIAVPVMCTTGMQMQFGMVRVLLPSFPYLVVTSKPLNLLVPADRIEAARCLMVFNNIANADMKFVNEPREHIKISLSRQLYHRKSMTQFTSVYKTKSSGLLHMLEVVSKLQMDEKTAQVVTLPITVRSGEANQNSFVNPDEIIFHKLRSYRSGLPHGDENKHVREAIVTALEAAVQCIHDAGVVHVDLYITNWMWKQIDGEISIKVIDWDSAHAVDEELTESTCDRLQRYYRPGQLHREATVATPELDLAYVRLVRENMHNDVLHTDNQNDLNERFRKLSASLGS
jgi:hypothetical protein